MKLIESKWKRTLPNKFSKTRSLNSNSVQGTYRFLPFIPLLASKVEAGEVSATTRYHPHPFYPHPKEEFRAHCDLKPIEGVYYCTGRRHLPLSKIVRNYYLEIGVDSPVSFEDIWCQICGLTKFDPKISCFFYTFRRIA